MTFAEAWADGVDIPSAFYPEEGAALFAAAQGCRTILEVGCEYGRSTCLVAAAAPTADVYLIDPFASVEILQRLVAALYLRQQRFSLYRMRSADVPAGQIPLVDLLHLDGDHTTAGVTVDCTRWLCRVRRGGILAVHDYQRASLPSVTQVVHTYTGDPHQWEILPSAGYLGLWRKQ